MKVLMKILGRAKDPVVPEFVRNTQGYWLPISGLPGFGLLRLWFTEALDHWNQCQLTLLFFRTHVQFHEPDQLGVTR